MSKNLAPALKKTFFAAIIEEMDMIYYLIIEEGDITWATEEFIWGYYLEGYICLGSFIWVLHFGPYFWVGNSNSLDKKKPEIHTKFPSFIFSNGL